MSNGWILFWMSFLQCITVFQSIKKHCSLLRMPAHVAACVGNAGHGSLISATKLFIFHHGHEQKPPPRPLQRWNQFTRRAGAMEAALCRIWRGCCLQVCDGRDDCGDMSDELPGCSRECNSEFLFYSLIFDFGFMYLKIFNLWILISISSHFS